MQFRGNTLRSALDPMEMWTQDLLRINLRNRKLTQRETFPWLLATPLSKVTTRWKSSLLERRFLCCHLNHGPVLRTHLAPSGRTCAQRENCEFQLARRSYW